MSAGYRALGRIFVFKDDFANAQATLESALTLMTSPDDIGALYYHLAYALWKSGDPETALASYIKALQTSNVVSAACVSEIEELQKDTGLPLPLSEEGLFDIARVLLSFVFRYRNDDALVGVLRSLETSLF